MDIVLPIFFCLGVSLGCIVTMFLLFLVKLTSHEIETKVVSKKKQENNQVIHLTNKREQELFETLESDL
jgi:uncharacterized membrane protein YciS (DUF1049 family)